jgi:hypothetical protein
MPEPRIDLLPPEIPTWAVALMALAAAGLWLGVRALTQRVRARRSRAADTASRVALAMLVPRSLAAVAAAWCLLQFIGRVATYACPWPLWVAALMLGLGVETVAACFRRERRTLSPRLGAAVLALRAAAVALTVLILMQPVLVRFTGKNITRRVAVLVDGSASMRFVDRQWQPRERLQWAAHAGLLDEARRNALTNETADAQKLWDGLPETVRGTVDGLCETTRVALAAELLGVVGRDFEIPSHGAFLDRLGEKYDVDLFMFGRGLKRVTRDELRAVAGGAPAFQTATDFTAALEGVLKEIPSEQLAGALLLSDGLHNADASVLPVARRFGALGAPVCGVAVGGTRLPFDVALADVAAPESVFLGDRVRLAATVRATGAAGRKIKVALVCGTNVVEESELEISSDDWRREIRLSHEPPTNGVVRYEVRAETLEGELFADNNVWRSDVAVNDDRINVLLVDHAPRWEFRYLRNLFFGRDKSVHLQSWLIHPDALAGASATPLPPASAGRKFGDAESGGWPVSREEWRAFDVIILGDLDAECLTPQVQEEIRACVADRGALLVLIGGPRAMPHAFPPDSPLAALAPFTVGRDFEIPSHDARDYWQPLERSFRLGLTPAGQTHPIMTQSGSLTENEEVWRSLPPFDWRLPVTAKPGAEVLAVAVPEGGEREQVLTDVRQAAEHLEAVMQHRARHALIAVQRVGRGKVLGLAFDRTWRLRYRTGDVRHHRFWGQVLRWGLGERLRAGQERFRAGTDRLVYGPEEPVVVMARVLNEDFSGVGDARLEAVLGTDEGREVTRVALTPRAGSHGFYEATLPPQTRAGAFKLDVVRTDTVARERVETSFLVTASRRPIEMGEVRPSREALEALAKGTGGRVVAPDALPVLAEAFGEGRRTVQERREVALWNSPYVLLLLALLLTAEWLLRKKGGLA